MGSLASRPKAPAIQQPQIITVPVSSPITTLPPNAPSAAASPASSPAAPASNSSATSSANSTPDNEVVEAEARSAGLLNRSRGVLSTVLTGFRGVLSDGDRTRQRKTLLGE